MNSTIFSPLFSSEIVNQLYPSSEECHCWPLQEQACSWFFGYVSLARALSIIQLMSLGFLRYYPFDSLDLVFIFITYCNLYLLHSSSIFGKLTGYNIHFILYLPKSLRISKVCLYGNKGTQKIYKSKRRNWRLSCHQNVSGPANVIYKPENENKKSNC